jgi:hypothetical protein
MDIKWALSQILPYRGANTASMSGISAALTENTASAVDSPRRVTRNHQRIDIASLNDP